MKRTIEIVVLIIGLSVLVFGQEAVGTNSERVRAEPDLGRDGKGEGRKRETPRDKQYVVVWR